MERMTIHRGLAELKLLDKRIENGIAGLVPMGYQQKDKPVGGAIPLDKFVEAVKADFQSVTDLIQRKTDIKAAIVRANGVTKVTIGGKEMTVADAINMKMLIVLKRSLIEDLRRKTTTLKTNAETQNMRVEANALKLAEQMLGKANVKLQDDDVKKTVEPYIENFTWRPVDPLDVDNLIKKLDEEVSKFDTEVDATLSESNAVTFIEIGA